MTTVLFKDNMKEVLSIVRCSFNSVFRRYFDVNSEWDCNYFVITVDRIHWLIEELKREYTKGDDSDIYDEEDYSKVMSCLSALSHEPDSDAVYLISWDK